MFRNVLLLILPPGFLDFGQISPSKRLYLSNLRRSRNDSHYNNHICEKVSCHFVIYVVVFHGIHVFPFIVLVSITFCSTLCFILKLLIE